MRNEPNTILVDMERFHLEIMRQAAKARSHHESTGGEISIDQIPLLIDLRRAAIHAVNYARQIVADNRALPKQFTYLGLEYLLRFPQEGPVQVLFNDQNLCRFLPGYVDPNPGN